MAHPDLFAGALSQLMRHQLCGCPRAGWQAAELLDRIAGAPGVDAETRALCEQMSARLTDLRTGPCH